MDRSGDNSLRPASRVTLQRLLFEDDWDTYSAVDANAVSPDPRDVVYLDTPQMISDALMASSFEGTTEEYWLQRQSSINERSEAATQEEYHQEVLTLEELGFTDEELGFVSTGLNVEVIDENIRRVKYENCSDETKKCVICLDKLKYSEEVSKLECGHNFHFGCIKNWLMVKNECPLCKLKAV